MSAWPAHHVNTRKSSAASAKLILAALGIVALLVAGRYLGAGTGLKLALQWISSLGTVAPVVFIAAYIVACVLFVPGSIITLGAGVLFGVIWGSIYVSIAATVGATLAFVIGRYLARDWVARQLAGRRNFEAIDAAVGREGWKIVALTRLSPVFPFNLLNYAYGLTRVRLGEYVIASWAGMLPGTIMYVYVGSLAGSLAEVGSDGTQPGVRWILNILGFAATAAVTFYAARLAHRALSEQTGSEQSARETADRPNHPKAIDGMDAKTSSTLP
jgi:uncharacterized membrane protein YdjX (TVP38/TMEM64 family)